MTDFDADEPVAPPKSTERKSFWTTDRIIGYSGAALALSAAFFPWYVFFNEDKFGVNVATSVLSRVLPDWVGRSTVAEMPSAIPNKNDLASLPRVDDLVTGTVPDEEKEADTTRRSAAIEQPFPARPLNFHLLHVANGKALIEDESGVYVVMEGSVLPDQSKLERLEERNGEWVLVNDRGEVYGNDGKRDQP